jgi:hypothetical protein
MMNDETSEWHTSSAVTPLFTEGCNIQGQERSEDFKLHHYPCMRKVSIWKTSIRSYNPIQLHA